MSLGGSVGLTGSMLLVAIAAGVAFGYIKRKRA
jgi:hypothetical protein